MFSLTGRFAIIDGRFFAGLARRMARLNTIRRATGIKDFTPVKAELDADAKGG